MDSWLTDIYNLGDMSAQKAVCTVCKQKADNGMQLFPICRKCDVFKIEGLPKWAQDNIDSDPTPYMSKEEIDAGNF